MKKSQRYNTNSALRSSAGLLYVETALIVSTACSKKMDSVKSTKPCRSCGGTAFRTDRPYGDFCSMMCALRGELTTAEKKEEAKRIRKIISGLHPPHPAKKPSKIE